MKHFLSLLALKFSVLCFGQLDLVFGPGFGAGYTVAKYDQLQASYASYLQDLENNTNGMSYEADPNFNAKLISDFLSFRIGASFEGGYVGFAFLPNTNIQTRNVSFSNNYGRKFVFSDRRHEYVFDIGYGSKKFDFFGTFGVNMNKYRMVSYAVYPDGSESLTNEYYYNGVYKNFDAGLSYGFGFQIKPVQYVGFEIRYLFASNRFPGERTDLVAENASMGDFSYAKKVGTEAYPLDYTKGFSQDNYIIPNFSQHYLSLSLIFHIDADKLKKNEKENK